MQRHKESIQLRQQQAPKCSSKIVYLNVYSKMEND